MADTIYIVKHLTQRGDGWVERVDAAFTDKERAREDLRESGQNGRVVPVQLYQGDNDG